MKLMKAQQPMGGNKNTSFNYSNMQASEEALNVVITALLTINHEEFDFGSMLGFLTSAVGNESQRTGSVALEAIAVVNKLTGTRFPSLLSSCNVSERVQNKIIERVQNESLPIITSDGTVQYSWSGKARRILNNENKNTVVTLRKNHSPKDSKGEFLSANKPLLRRKENLGIDVPYPDPRVNEARGRGASNGTNDYDQVLSTRSDIMPLSSNEMDAITKYDRDTYGGRDIVHSTGIAETNLESEGHTLASNGNGEGYRLGMGNQQIRKAAAANGDSNGMPKYVPQVRRSITFGGDASDDKGSVATDVGTRGYSKEGGATISASVSVADMDKRHPQQQKRFIRPSRPASKAETAAGDHSRDNEQGSTNTNANGNSRPGSNTGWRGGGRSMVVDKLAILKKRQESRRANSANAVLQRAKSDPTMGYYMNEPLHITNRSIFSSNSLCPPPNRYSTPRMARTARARAQAQKCNITVTDSSESNSTFASGGIGTPKTFRKSIFNTNDTRSPVCRLVSSKYERNGLDEFGKPLEFATNELQPCLDPDGTMKDVLSALAIANAANRKELNWIAQYEALTNARRLVVNHSSIVLAQLHDLVIAILPAIVELRSYTAKNALQLVREIFQMLKGYVDNELERIVPVLMKKAGEMSTAGRKNFLAIEADSVLTDMVVNCNEVKAAQALLSCAKHKTGSIRTKVIMHLTEIVSKNSRRVLQNRDLMDKILTTAASFLDEPSIETRTHSKHCLWTLGELAPHEVRNFLNKVSDIKAKQVRNAVTNPPPQLPVGKTTGVRGTRSRERNSNGSQYAAEGMGFQSLAVDNTQQQRPKPPSRSRSSRGSQEAEEGFQNTLDKISSKDWRERYQGLQALEKDLIRLGDIQESKLISAFDALVPRISDGNSKVVVQALQTISDIVTLAKNTSVVVLNILMPNLASTIGSTNEKIRRKASATLYTMCCEVDSVYLIQNMSHCVKHSGPRSQPVLIEHLSHLIPAVYSRKPQLVNKYVIPVAFSMLNEKSTGVRMSMQKLVKSLHKSMGTQLLALADERLGGTLQNKLHDMLTSEFL